MTRVAELRKKLNETQKSKIKTGLNTELKSTYKDGTYLVNEGTSLSVKDLTAAQAWDLYAGGARLVEIPKAMVDSMVKVAKTGKKGLQTFLETGRLEVKEKKEKKHTETNALGDTIEAGVEAAAQIGTSILGFYADVGAKAEAKVNIKGEVFEFEAKLFREVKAGVRAGRLGVSAQVSAEVAIEDKVTASVKKFTTASGMEVTVQLYVSLKAFAKAEAYAGLGIATKTGAEAFAGVGVEGKIGADIKRKKTGEKEITAGGAAVSITLKIGAAIGASAGITIQEVFEDDNPYIEFKHGASLAFIVGAEYEISAKLLTDVYNEAKDEIVKKIENKIGTEVLNELEEKMKEVRKELEFHVEDAARKMRRGWDNTQNYSTKLLIAIEKGMGHQSSAMSDEIKRQVDKLHQYKKELSVVIDKFGSKGIDDNVLEQIINEVTDPAFHKQVNKWFGKKIDNKALKKDLMLGLERYDRRIVKLNEFLDSSYKKALAKINTEIQDLSFSIGSLRSKDIPTDFKDSKAYKKMIKKIEEVQGMLSSIDKIIGEKKKLVNEVKDQSGLKTLIGQMGKQYAQIKSDFKTLIKIMSDYISGLPATK